MEAFPWQTWCKPCFSEHSNNIPVCNMAVVSVPSVETLHFLPVPLLDMQRQAGIIIFVCTCESDAIYMLWTVGLILMYLVMRITSLEATPAF
jgi:hypothetical protein